MRYSCEVVPKRNIIIFIFMYITNMTVTSVIVIVFICLMGTKKQTFKVKISSVMAIVQKASIAGNYGGL